MSTNTNSHKHNLILKPTNENKLITYKKQVNYKTVYFRKEKCILIYVPHVNEIHFLIKENNKNKISYTCEKLSMTKFIETLKLKKRSINIEFHLSYINYGHAQQLVSSYTYFIHYINEYDENLKINILENSTLFSMNMFVNGIYINIYKKVINRKDSNYIKNITSNFIKFRSKALDEISKMNEFIYNNYDFMYNLIKFKLMFIYKSIGFSSYKINNIIQINVNEVNQLYKIMNLVKSECTDTTPSGYYDFFNGRKSVIDSRIQTCNKLSINHRGIISKLSCFLNHSHHSILNKQNFEKIQNFELPFKNIGITRCTYISPNGTLFISDDSKLINFNKKFNYYHDKNISGFKKVKFFKHQIVKNEITIYNNIMKPKVNFNSDLINNNSYINSGIKINNNLWLYSTRPITNKFEIDINKNIDNLLNNLNYFNEIKSNCKHYVFEMISLMLLNSVKQNINPTNIIIKPQYINVSKLNQIQTAIDNINFNYKNKDEILTLLNKVMKFIDCNKFHIIPGVYIDFNIKDSLLIQFLLKLSKNIGMQKLKIEISILRNFYNNKFKETGEIPPTNDFISPFATHNISNYVVEDPINIKNQISELIEILILMKAKYTEKLLNNISHYINEMFLKAI